MKKVYGGVVAPPSNLTTFEIRNTDNNFIKKAIAKTASPFIEPHDIIYIDSGTTTNTLLENVDTNMPFTLLTNNLDIINMATTFENVHLIVIGNTYKAATRSFINMYDKDYLLNFNIDKAFMAATGVSITNGLSNSDPLECEIKKQIIKQATQVYLLVDHTKFEKNALYSYATLQNVHTVVTNVPVPKKYVTYFSENNITLATASQAKPEGDNYAINSN